MLDVYLAHPKTLVTSVKLFFKNRPLKSKADCKFTNLHAFQMEAYFHRGLKPSTA